MAAGTICALATGISTVPGRTNTRMTWGTGRPTAVTTPTPSIVMPAAIFPACAEVRLPKVPTTSIWASGSADGAIVNALGSRSRSCAWSYSTTS